MRGYTLYVGGLPRETKKRDLECFLKGYGKLNRIIIKNRYAFVEFDDSRYAEEAVHELNGRKLLGIRVTVEMAKENASKHDTGLKGREIHHCSCCKYRREDQQIKMQKDAFGEAYKCYLKKEIERFAPSSNMYGKLDDRGMNYQRIPRLEGGRFDRDVLCHKIPKRRSRSISSSDSGKYSKSTYRDYPESRSDGTRRVCRYSRNRFTNNTGSAKVSTKDVASEVRVVNNSKDSLRSLNRLRSRSRSVSMKSTYEYSNNRRSRSNSSGDSGKYSKSSCSDYSKSRSRSYSKDSNTYDYKHGSQRDSKISQKRSRSTCMNYSRSRSRSHSEDSNTYDHKHGSRRGSKNSQKRSRSTCMNYSRSRSRSHSEDSNTFDYKGGSKNSSRRSGPRSGDNEPLFHSGVGSRSRSDSFSRSKSSRSMSRSQSKDYSDCTNSGGESSSHSNLDYRKSRSRSTSRSKSPNGCTKRSRSESYSPECVKKSRYRSRS
nr:serine/arginine-rich splicing factor 4-like isoform X2 [Leptinotarsa decemlineata]